MGFPRREPQPLALLAERLKCSWFHASVPNRWMFLVNAKVGPVHDKHTVYFGCNYATNVIIWTIFCE